MTTVTDFQRTLHVGRTADDLPLWIEVDYDNDRLSISGVSGPLKNGNAKGSCGQNRDDLVAMSSFEPGWSQDIAAELRRVWETWHLNDMQAGTPAQTAHLAALTFPGYPTSHYEWAKDQLARANLQPDPSTDPPYSYGSAWLTIDVPTEVLDWLRALPEPGHIYPWAPDRWDTR